MIEPISVEVTVEIAIDDLPEPRGGSAGAESREAPEFHSFGAESLLGFHNRDHLGATHAAPPVTADFPTLDARLLKNAAGFAITMPPRPPPIAPPHKFA